MTEAVRWRSVTFKEFLAWAADKGKLLREEEQGDGTVVLTFWLGTARCLSRYDAGWGEMTPGEGLLPPNMEVAVD